MKRYRICLEHGRNCDLPSGYWDDPIDDPRTFADCDTLREAVDAFRRWITRNHLGAGNLTSLSGTIFDQTDGQAVARVSYNGRVWCMQETSHYISIDLTSDLETLCAKYVDAIGYDPVADDPRITRDEIAITLAEHAINGAAAA